MGQISVKIPGHFSAEINSNGIEIQFRYLEDGAQRYLEEIAYSIFRVEFEYDDTRLDSFVNRRAGFDVETAKRLAQIRIVSMREGGRKVLRRYDFTYAQDPLRKTSLLQSVSLSAGEGDAAQQMPVLQMGYSELDLTISAPQELASKGGNSELPDLDDPNVSLIDLAGDGLPDIIATTATGTFVWRNLGDGNWAEPSKVEDLPGQRALGDAVLQFADLEGNGTLDLLIQDGSGSGFLRNDAGGMWQPFQPYGHALPFDVTDPELRLIDVDGDGRIDAIRSADDALEIHTNNGTRGWSVHPLRIPRIYDKDVFPDVFFSDPRIHFADMTGDGLMDIVELRDRDISYWPYLGHGQYGHRRKMENLPDVPAGVPVENLVLVDVVGDGTADLVLTESDRITIWLNFDGRAFGEPVVIEHGPQTRGARTYLVDVAASGRAGILYNRNAAGGAINRYGFIPLGQARTPFLMTRIDNGMGSITEMTYAPVETMRGPARRAGKDWTSFLPFPQQVLTSISVRDVFVSTRAVARFSYEDGHYNGERREFRGFGKVIEIEEGDSASPRIVRNYSFDVGDDLGLTEAERRQRPLTERIYSRARSGLPLSMTLSTRPESGGTLTEKERMTYQWDVREEVADPANPVLAALEKSVLTLQHSVKGPAQAQLNTTQAYDDQGNKSSAVESFGSYTGVFVPEKSRKTEIQYASGPAKVDGWTPRAVAEMRVTDEKGNLVEHNRRYYDGTAHLGAPLGEMTKGNLTRIEDCMLASDEVIQQTFPGTDLEALGFHLSPGAEGWWRDAIRVERDASGRVTELLDPLGHPHSITYDSAGLHAVRVVNAVGHELVAEIDPDQEAVSSVTNPSGMKEQQIYDALGRVVALLHFDAAGAPYCRRAVRHDRADFSGVTPVPAQTIALRPNRKMSYEDLSAFFDAGPEDLAQVRKSVIRVAGTGHSIEKRASREATADGHHVVALSGAQCITPRGQTKSASWPRVDNGFEWSGKVEPAETDPQFTFAFDHRGRTVETREPEGKLRLTDIDPWYSEQKDLLPARGLSSRVRLERYNADGSLLRLDEDATSDTGGSVIHYQYV
ncbi:MAG: toxin TcdB middle/N-terminal domain-containing protein [Planctomycetaceae bacterium]